MENRKNILVIEDEAHIAEGLRLNLSLQGYNVEVSEDGVEALNVWEEKGDQLDLIVLDLMLPKLDGYSVLKKIRSQNEKIPILVLSAKDGSVDKVRCLSGGVDDYLSKPFHLEEFLLRVKRLLTKSDWYKVDNVSEVESVYIFGDNKIDFAKSSAYGRDGEIKLTPKEIDVLKIFISNKGKPLSRKDLLEQGWGYDQGTSTRTLDNFIVRFRKYFEEDPKNPVYFKSLRSVGYVFDFD